MFSTSKRWIEFNIDALYELKCTYLAAQDAIKEQLYGLDPNSKKQIKQYFADFLDIQLENVKISTLERALLLFDSDSEEFNFTNGIIYYLKLKYSLKNYIDYILKHHQEGKIYLRDINGDWRFPNRQPVPSSPELQQCIIGESYELRHTE